MTSMLTLPPAALACVTALLGLAFGLAYFGALRRTADLITGGRNWIAAAALTFARIAGIVLLLTLMARFGALPLLAGFAGILAARMLTLRSLRRAR